MKYILLIGLIYFAYRYFNVKKKVSERGSDFPTPREKEMHENDLGEYTDYEEID